MGCLSGKIVHWNSARFIDRGDVPPKSKRIARRAAQRPTGRRDGEPDNENYGGQSFDGAKVQDIPGDE
jgi:hypothetical protein